MTLCLLRPLLPRPPKTRRRERRVPEAHHLARNVDVQVRFGIHQGEDGHQFLSDPPLLPNLGELLLPPENGAKLRLIKKTSLPLYAVHRNCALTRCNGSVAQTPQ